MLADYVLTHFGVVHPQCAFQDLLVSVTAAPSYVTILCFLVDTRSLVFFISKIE